MSSLPVIEASDIKNINRGSSLFQSGFWASFKSFFGWKPYYFLINGKNFIVLVRTFRGIFSIAYVPFAPDYGEGESILEISEKIKKYLPGNTLFIRYDLPWIREKTVLNSKGNKSEDSGNNNSGPSETDAACAGKKQEAENYLSKLVKSSVDIQPPSTVVLDLTKNEDEILKGMKSKTRYNIRLSARKGVVVKQCGVEALEEWYDIYRETAERDKIALHRMEYYKKLFTLSESEKDSPDLRIYMAEVDGENIAGIITSFYGGNAIYLYGASLNKKRETMPAYSLQWKAIMDAKAEGCTSYDFFGIPPADDPSHPMHGLYRFKTGFGGKLIHRYGCYDYPFHRISFAFYRIAENIRNFYYKKLKKR